MTTITFVDRVKMSSQTTGTGFVTLNAPVAGYRSLVEAGVSDGASIRYLIEEGDAWEIGTALYDASAQTLTRTVISSSNGSKIYLGGNAVVSAIATAADMTSASDAITYSDLPNLPTTLPPQRGVLWNNNGVLSIS